jgi:predicted HAD superfamily Cof-like phosphohydrolase
MIDIIEMWHEVARPTPSNPERHIQTGVHFEEIAEMLGCMRGADEYSDLMLDRLHTALTTVSLGMKKGVVKFEIRDREDFLDSLCDQIVTAVGTGHCSNMYMAEAVRRVNTSNWSKYKNGKPEFDAQGKIIKPDSYRPPNLEGLY